MNSITLAARSWPRLRTLLFAALLSFTIVRPAAAVDYTDLWVSQSELGWGVNLDQSDSFIFATFFIYGSNQQPTWYSGELTLGANGVWSGPLYLSTGSYFGAPWSTAQKTINQVGTVTFTPSSSYAGTLTYNVGNVNVAKVSGETRTSWKRRTVLDRYCSRMSTACPCGPRATGSVNAE